MFLKMAHLKKSYLWQPALALNRGKIGFRVDFEVWELQNIVRLPGALQVSRGGEHVRRNSAGMSGYFMETATRQQVRWRVRFFFTVSKMSEDILQELKAQYNLLESQHVTKRKVMFFQLASFRLFKR